MYTKCQLEGFGTHPNEISVTCRKNGTLILPQCNNAVTNPRHFFAVFKFSHRIAYTNRFGTGGSTRRRSGGIQGEQVSVVHRAIPFAIAKARLINQPAHGFSPRPMRSEISA
jgi:hypothetical protein